MMSKRAVKKHLWKPAYEWTYGVTPQHNKDGVVKLGTCKFCVTYGREEAEEEIDDVGNIHHILNGNPNKKKKRKILTIMTYNSLRTDRFKEHLQKQHPKRWAVYQNIIGESLKKEYFKQSTLDTVLVKKDDTSFYVKNEVVAFIDQILCNDKKKGNQWWKQFIIQDIW